MNIPNSTGVFYVDVDSIGGPDSGTLFRTKTSYEKTVNAIKSGAMCVMRLRNGDMSRRILFGPLVDYSIDDNQLVFHMVTENFFMFFTPTGVTMEG